MATSQKLGSILSLGDEETVEVSKVGSKAANLASLQRAGFSIPFGVVLPVSTVATDEVLDWIIELTSGRPLAVRSSATAEDLPDASFAGQYETVLNVRGYHELKSAIKACLASAASDRVVSYQGVGSAAMAVLIQPMLDPEAAGVLFTAHPVTGRRDQVVINAVSGLGDKLVSGEITPEEWTVTDDKSEGAGVVLETEQVRDLAALARRVEAHFGFPQDIEWAIEDGAIHLLQARPITSLPEPPVQPIPIELEVPDGYWEHDASHSPKASFPIDSMIPGLLADVMERWAIEFGYLFDGIEFREIGGWTYQRIRPLGGKEGPQLPMWLMWLLVRMLPPMRRRIAASVEAVRTDKPGRYIQKWNDTWQPELDGTIKKLLAVDRPSLTDPDLRSHVGDVIDLCRRGIEVHALVHGSLAPIIYEFVETCEALLGWEMGETLTMVSGTSFKSTEPARRLHQLALMATTRPQVFDVDGTAESDIPDFLAEVYPEFATDFADYMTDYGHRALGDTSAEPTIAERPSFVLDMIANQVTSGYDPEQVDKATARIREEAVARARDMLSHGTPSAERFEKVLARALMAYPAREDNEFYSLSGPFALLRYVVLELGNRLATRGVIDQRDDVFYLNIDEAQDALAEMNDHRDLIAIRKGQRAWAEANPGPRSYGKESPLPASLDFLPENGRLPMQSMLWSLESMLAIEASKTEQSDASAIVGTPVSAGIYTGPVRIVKNENEFDKLRTGDVLVCPITSPVWSVLFPSIGALVTDTGGVLSHPAIIAREYQIPGVVATGNATSLLVDGQIVTVDGSKGTVTS